MKKLKVAVEYILRREYEIPVSNDDYEKIVNGDCHYEDDPEIDVAHEAFMTLRSDFGLNDYFIPDETDYCICDEDGATIVDWG